MQMPVFVALFLAPVFVPLDLVGGWVHSVARVNPVTALLDGSRDLLGGGDIRVLLTFGVAGGLAALFALWAVGGLRAAERTGG
jgi:ABC-2 type transport system permease protein